MFVWWFDERLWCKLVVEWRVWLFCKGMVMDHYSFIENSFGKSWSTQRCSFDVIWWTNVIYVGCRMMCEWWRMNGDGSLFIWGNIEKSFGGNSDLHKRCSYCHTVWGVGFPDGVLAKFRRRFWMEFWLNLEFSCLQGKCIKRGRLAESGGSGAFSTILVCNSKFSQNSIQEHLLNLARTPSGKPTPQTVWQLSPIWNTTGATVAAAASAAALL